LPGSLDLLIFALDLLYRVNGQARDTRDLLQFLILLGHVLDRFHHTWVAHIYQAMLDDLGIVAHFSAPFTVPLLMDA
jgi:hypothetical protein